MEMLISFLTRPNSADKLKAALKVAWTSLTPQQSFGLITCGKRCIGARNHAKQSGLLGAFTAHYRAPMFSFVDISVKNFPFDHLRQIHTFSEKLSYVRIIKVKRKNILFLMNPYQYELLFQFSYWNKLTNPLQFKQMLIHPNINVCR